MIYDRNNGKIYLNQKTLKEILSESLYENIIEFQTNPELRRVSNIYKMMMAGQFKNIASQDEEKIELASQLDSMITVLNGTMEDNWTLMLGVDIERSMESTTFFKNFRLYLVLRYPDLIIRNSEGREHKLKETFVVSEILSKKFREHSILSLGTLHGFRSTMTDVEVKNNYYHSHFSRCSLIEYDFGDSFSEPDLKIYSPFSTSKICIGGGGTPLSSSISEMELEYSKELFGMFLWNLDSMLRYESIEGLPYTYMATLSKNLYINGDYYKDESNISSIIKFVVNNIKSFDFNLIVVEGNRYQVLNDEKAAKTIKEILIQDMIINESNYADRSLCTSFHNRDSIEYDAEKYYLFYINRASSSSQEILATNIKYFSESEDPPYFYFRDGKIPLIIESTEDKSKEEVMRGLEVHPLILKKIIKNINNELYKRCVINSRKINERY